MIPNFELTQTLIKQIKTIFEKTWFGWSMESFGMAHFVLYFCCRSFVSNSLLNEFKEPTGGFCCVSFGSKMMIL